MEFDKVWSQATSLNDFIINGPIHILAKCDISSNGVILNPGLLGNIGNATTNIYGAIQLDHVADQC